MVGTLPGTGRPPGLGALKKPFPENYYWMHGYKCNKEHTSATSLYQATGQRNDAMAANTLGGSAKDKGCDT